jgi:hypothetical protein
MTVEEAKAKIFHWLCSRYHDAGKGNEYIEKDTVKYAIGIPEEVFEKALNEFCGPRCARLRRSRNTDTPIEVRNWRSALL